MKRRAWLIGSAAAAGGALMVGALGLTARRQYFGSRASAASGTPQAPLLAGWVKVDADNGVTVLVPHCDMGQGSWTALAMMVAEELDAPWSAMRVEQAPADPAFANRFFLEGFLLEGRQVPGALRGTADLAFGEVARLAHMQMTGGSAAVRHTGQLGLRSAGAAARDLLVRAAAARLGVVPGELATADCVVIHAATGRSFAYGELVRDASKLPMTTGHKLKDKSAFRLIETAPPRLDIPAKVSGRTQYGIDVQLPGMLVATVMAAPVRGEVLLGVDPKPALALPGVRKVVRMASSVAVVADGFWQARRGLLALEPRFSTTDRSRVTSTSISRQFTQALSFGTGKVLQSRGDPNAAAGMGVSASYEVPFLHHATMEPINVTAAWDGKRLRAWGSEQDALGARANLAQAAGLALGDVDFTPLSLGGGFGRRSAPKKDHLVQAVAIAKAMAPAPVKLIWSREEDFAQGAYRPAVATRIEATLDPDGRVRSWRQRFIDTPELINEGFPIPYDVPHIQIEAVASHTHVPQGAWRSVAHSQHGFFTECFMDELAAAAGLDPVVFRSINLPRGSRHQRVLAEAARRGNWGASLPARHGRGIALVESFGSVVAEVIEVSVREDGAVRVHSVTAVVDCGFVVHADTAVAQVQGAIVMGLSAALGEAITIDRGEVVQRSFPDYPVLRMPDIPPIQVSFIDSDGPLGGLGEVGLPPAAPALANAIHAATGKRVRSLPVERAQAVPAEA